MGDVGGLLGLADGVEQSSGGGLEEGRRRVLRSNPPLHLQIHLQNKQTNKKTKNRQVAKGSANEEECFSRTRRKSSKSTWWSRSGKDSPKRAALSSSERPSPAILSFDMATERSRTVSGPPSPLPLLVRMDKNCYRRKRKQNDEKEEARNDPK